MTTLGPSFNLIGDITSDEDLVIEGRLSGHVLIRNAALTIGERARLEADVRGARVHVHGEVTGAITASDRIELTRSATVNGSLSANRVVLADGATFNGGIDMDRRTIATKMAQYKAAHTA
jgi:cytoskeletal protein CcmA (bactofilin family)